MKRSGRAWGSNGVTLVWRDVRRLRLGSAASYGRGNYRLVYTGLSR
jgi:hypothetical protein